MQVSRRSKICHGRDNALLGVYSVGDSSGGEQCFLCKIKDDRGHFADGENTVLHVSEGSRSLSTSFYINNLLFFRVHNIIFAVIFVANTLH